MFKSSNLYFSKIQKQKKKFQKYLYWLMDHHYLSNWFYNGSFHVTFKDVDSFNNFSNLDFLYDNFGDSYDK